MEFRLGKNENSGGPPPAFRIGGMRAHDGVALRTFDTGDPPKKEAEQLPIVLLNGLGGPHQVWFPLLSFLGARHRLLSWDYRGLYGSALHDLGQRLDLEAHALDLGRLLETSGVQRAHLVAWSMGVQVALEATRCLPPESFASLTLMNGTFGRPLRGLGLPGSGRITQRLAQSAGILAGRGLPFADRLARSTLPHRLLTGLGVLAPSVESSHLQSMVREFRELDGAAYARLLHELSVHDAEGTLRDVRCPTLVVAGSADRFTPPHFARRIAREIRSSELFVVSGGSHYAPIEAPELIAARIEDFLRRRAPAAALQRVRFARGPC